MLYGMGMLVPLILHLAKLCIIGFALLVQGSLGKISIFYFQFLLKVIEIQRCFNEFSLVLLFFFFFNLCK